MPLLRNEISRLAGLARLEFTPHEIDTLVDEMTLILGYFDQLKTVDTSAVDLKILSSGKNRLREDVVEESLEQSQALANAPNSEGDYFHVPRVIG